MAEAGEKINTTQVPSAVVAESNGSGEEGHHANNLQASHHHNDVQAARKGLLRAIWQTNLVPRFSSKPIDMEDYFSDRGSIFNGSINSGGSKDSDLEGATAEGFKSSLHESSNLTKSEQMYLQNLLKSDDLVSIRKASVRLADKELFPTEADHSQDDPPSTKTEEGRKTLKRRNSQVQQQLFELHEKATVMPSAILKRMSSARAGKASRPLFISHTNSLMLDDEPLGPEEEKSSKDEQLFAARKDKGKDDDESLDSAKRWNPLKDLNTWIDGSEGVEVDNEGQPEISSPTSNPFKILGTSADDTSCHPHVLSPPLMEGLQLFMPESLQEHHYWLKYSLVRDGPGFMKMLRHCRASQHTVLAIETTDGHVFGSFTSQPWRLISRGYYGSKEAFVWRMRRSRNETVKSVMEQILMESQIDVFPFTGSNNMVQLCTADGIGLGHGEVEDDIVVGASTDREDEMDNNGKTEHYGYALKLDKSMATGTTSSSETFGNPCLLQREKRGETFEVANVELWSLTPHETVEEADQAEMRLLFLQENRNSANNLNLIEILVGR